VVPRDPCNKVIQWSQEIIVTHLDEPWTHHFQLGLPKVFIFFIFTMVGSPKQIVLSVSGSHSYEATISKFSPIISDSPSFRMHWDSKILLNSTHPSRETTSNIRSIFFGYIRGELLYIKCIIFTIEFDCLDLTHTNTNDEFTLLSRGKGWDHINWLNSATFLCLSQSKT
jgi:hypothetical protein